jgi:molybdopterin/thiamine biosynthesis adenylyltransferase
VRSVRSGGNDVSSKSEIFSREKLAGYDPLLMARSVALVVGAGALGQNAAQNLALAGIGELRIVDKDRFEEHNRTRSPAYPLPEEQERFGMNKARAVACKLRRLMTTPSPLMRYAENWIEELGDGAFQGVSVVIGCVDRQSARAYLSDRARLHGLPFIEGGFEGPDISLSCYPAARGEQAVTAPCWRCSNQETENEGGAFSCARYARRVEEAGFIPAIQNAAATLAGLQCEAAILSLNPGQDAPLDSHALRLNIRTGQTRKIKLATDRDCPGLHRALDGEPIKLEVKAEDQVGRLLEEVSRHLDGMPTLELNSPLIWNAPCTECKKLTAVRQPDWAWLASPRCEECGGSFPRETEDISSTPLAYCQLTPAHRPRLLQVSCEQIGLPPLSLFEVTGQGGASKFFELAGSVEQLYRLGDVNG